MARQTFKTDVEWTGVGVQCVAKINNHKIIIDEPADLGGSDQGPNPVELILASLGGCLNIVLAMLAPKYKVDLKSAKVVVEGDLDPDGFMEIAEVRTGFQEIRFDIKVESDSPAEKVNKLIEHAKRICPVKDTLCGVPIIQID